MAMFRFSIRADNDLIDIAQYTLRLWGEDQAIVYLGDLEDCCQKLADRPGLGRPCDDLRPGLRRMEHGSHVIFYRQQSEGIVVSRILHSRMLPERQPMDEEGE